MVEPLTTALILDLLPKLLVAFPSKLSSQNIGHTADVYRNGLRGLSGSAVREAIDTCIRTDEYFPKVARIRELASVIDRKRNQAAIAARLTTWDTCGVCGARATTHPAYVIVKDAKGVETRQQVGERLDLVHLPGPHGIREQAQEDVA